MPLFEKKHIGHEKHLCTLVDKGISVEEYKKLVKEGKFVCMICGRVAAEKNSLCIPLPL